MSEMAKEAREKSKAKAERMVRSDPHARVDASSYSPDGPMHADVKTGMRPVSPRQFRRGGKVAGEASAARADRKPRASGGRTLTADSYINRDVKEANQERDGTKFIGGLKRGGRAHKDMGGMALPNWAAQVARKDGGRIGKLVGGALSPLQRMAIQRKTRIPTATPVAGAGMPVKRPLIRASGGQVHGSSCSCAKCGGGRVERKDGGKSDFAGGGPKGKKGFPMGDAKHQRLAISGATRSEKAGNISKLKEDSIKAEARKKLGIAKAGGGAINDGTRPVGGRLARKGGGRTKKGTNVNIIITQPPARPPMAPMPPAGARPPGAAPPVGMGQGMPPAGTMPMPPQQATGIPPAAPMMPRKSGGRINDGWSGKLAAPGKYPIDAGAGGGLGRLEKAQRAARG